VCKKHEIKKTARPQDKSERSETARPHDRKIVRQ